MPAEPAAVNHRPRRREGEPDADWHARLMAWEAARAACPPALRLLLYVSRRLFALDQQALREAEAERAQAWDSLERRAAYEVTLRSRAAELHHFGRLIQDAEHPGATDGA